MSTVTTNINYEYPFNNLSVKTFSTNYVYIISFQIKNCNKVTVNLRSLIFDWVGDSEAMG